MIKNLPNRLAESGKVKIGIKGKMVVSAQGKEFRPPQKLDHFRIVTTERDENGDYVIDIELQNRIKESGNGIINKDGNLVGIPFRLLYDDIDLNFFTELVCYNSGKRVCYGDGEVAYKRLDEFKVEHPCPCNRLEPNYEGKDKCKPNGKLSLIIDEAGLFGQCHTFRTTGYNSVTGILSSLRLLQAATKGRLAGLPLMLTLTAKQTQTPGGVPTKVYIVGICYRGSMLDLRQDVLELVKNEQKFLSSVTPSLNLSTPNIQAIEEDEEEFVEEFYPEARGTNKETIQKEEKIEKREPEKDNIEESTEKKSNPETGVPEKKSERDEDRISQAVEDDCEKGKSEGESEEKIVNSEKSSNKKSDGIDFSDAHFLNKKGAYAALYNRMIVAMQEGNKEEAGKLARRLTKEFLKLWFEREHPEIIFEEDKKSLYLEEMDKLLAMDNSPLGAGETLEFSIQEESEPAFIEKIIELADQKSVADAMTEYFKPIPINRTLDKEGLIKTARKLIEQGQGQEQGQDKEEIREQESNQGKDTPADQQGGTPADQQEDSLTFSERKFDTESGPVEKDQLRTMVQLKNELVNLKLIDPLKWYNFVGQFLDAEGNPHGTAKNMSKKQADCLIAMLDKRLEGYSKEIPF